MKTLGAYYWADVSSIEDNVAHLIEHCMVEYLYKELAKAGEAFFSCDGETSADNIKLDIEVYSEVVAERIDNLIMAQKPDIPLDVITGQMRRIEIEEELPLRYDSLELVAANANKVWHQLDWQFGEPRKHVSTGDKPKNKLIQYGLMVKRYQLRLNYFVSDENRIVADVLAARFLRDKNIYATAYRPDGSGATYEFKTMADTSTNYLNDRLEGIEEYCSSDDFCVAVERNLGVGARPPKIKFSLTML